LCFQRPFLSSFFVRATPLTPLFLFVIVLFFLGPLVRFRPCKWPSADKVGTSTSVSLLYSLFCCPLIFFILADCPPGILKGVSVEPLPRRILVSRLQRMKQVGWAPSLASSFFLTTSPGKLRLTRLSAGVMPSLWVQNASKNVHPVGVGAGSACLFSSSLDFCPHWCN